MNTKNNKSTILSASLAATALLSVPAWAHHGRDFLVTEDYALPSPGSGHFHAMFDWEDNSEGDEFAVSPHAIIGVLPRTAVSVAARFDKLGSDSWDYASVTPSLHFQLTDPDSKCPFRVSLSAGYQFTSGSGGESVEVEHELAEDGHADHGHDHDEAEGHAHGSVHNHDADQFIGRLVLEQSFGETKVIVNLISAVPDGGSVNWGYAAGVSHKVLPNLALGLEATGDFESGGEHELILGTYFEANHSLALKLGVGFGLTDSSPDVAIHSGFVLRF